MDYEALRSGAAATTSAATTSAATRRRPADNRRIAAGLLRLRQGLDAHFAAATGAATAASNDGADGGPSNKVPARGLRIATWNLREFATANKYGRRLDDAYWYIAEILARFDLVALQEVRGDLAALDRVLALLGDDWRYIATDVSPGRDGNGGIRSTDPSSSLTVDV